MEKDKKTILEIEIFVSLLVSLFEFIFFPTLVQGKWKYMKIFERKRYGNFGLLRFSFFFHDLVERNSILFGLIQFTVCCCFHLRSFSRWLSGFK